jgi:hypothetical protein
MNITEWHKLPPAELEQKLRDMQMTREEFEATVAGILADRRMAEEMRAAGTLPTALPQGKLGDSLSYGVPRVESEDDASS